MRARLLVQRAWHDSEVSLPAITLAAELDRDSNVRMIGIFEALEKQWTYRRELAVFAADFAERMAVGRTPVEAVAWLQRAATVSQILSDDPRQIACLDRAVALAPTDAKLRLERARALRATNLNAALADMDAVLQRDFDNRDALELRGELLLAVGRPDSAVADLERYFLLHSRPEWNPKTHAVLESARAKLAELAALAQTIAEMPANAEPRLKRAAVLGAMGARREAVADLSGALELLPPEQVASPLFDRAQHLTALGDWAAALSDWSRLSELDASVPAHQFGCARALFELGRHEEALQACNRAIELQPRDMRQFELRADCHRALGNLAAALADTTEAYTFGEPTREQWFALAAECEACQQFDAALTCLRRTRGFPRGSGEPLDRLDSRDAIARIYAQRGVSDWEATEELEWRQQFLAQIGRLNEHRRTAEAATIARLFVLRGWQAFNAQDFTAAHTLATQALDLTPYDTATLNLTIFSLRKLGRREDSLAYISRLKTGECGPQFEEARASAWAKVYDGQFDEAQLDFEEAMRLCPSERANVEIEQKRAVAHQKERRAHELMKAAAETASKGNTNEAFALYDQAVAIAPRDETILNARARLMLSYRGLDAAENEYRRMLRADPSSFYANLGLDYIRQLRNNERLRLLDEQEAARRAAPAPERSGGGCSGCSGAGSRNYWNSSWVPLGGGSASDAIYFRCYSCSAVGSPY